MPSLFDKRYSPQRKLGAGRLGEIYAALQVGDGLQRPVALRQLTEVNEERPEVCRLFLEDMRHASALTHPNILRVLDVGRGEGGQFYLVSDHVEGCSLRRLAEVITAKELPLPMGVGVGIVLQILTGLRYAHRYRDDAGRRVGFAHRAMTPSTILISTEGGVFIADFGFARAERQLLRQLGEEPTSSRFAYLAPEAVLGEPLDPRADIFAVGVMLYELTLGRRLQRAKSFSEMRTAVESAIQPPTFVDPEYPPELELVVMRALERHADERYDTAAEMLEELAAYAHKASLHTAPWDLARYVSNALGVREQRAMDVEPDLEDSESDDDVSFRPSGTSREDHLAVQLRRPVQPLMQHIPKPLEHTVMVTADLVEGELDIDSGEADILLEPAGFLAQPSPDLAAGRGIARGDVLEIGREGSRGRIELLAAEDDDEPEVELLRPRSARGPGQRRAKPPKGPSKASPEVTMELVEDDLLGTEMGEEDDAAEEVAQAIATPPPPPPTPKERPDSADEKPDSADEKPGPADEKPDPADEKPDSADEKPDSADEKPDSADEKPDSADEKPDSADEKPDSADEKPDPADEKLGGEPGMVAADETSAEAPGEQAEQIETATDPGNEGLSSRR